jgi:hypothetical protein
VSAATLIHVAALDVQAGYEDEVEEWYSEKHLPSVLAQPGWVAAHRFRCLEGEPRELTIFDLELSGAQLAEGVSASPLANEQIGRRIRDYHARTYRLVFESADDRVASDLINVITTDVVPGYEAEFNRWYNEIHIPEILACPGWTSARRYRCLDGDPPFLAIYALEDEQRPFSTREYEAAVGWDDQVAHLRGYHGFRIYRRLGSVPSHF